MPDESVTPIPDQAFTPAVDRAATDVAAPVVSEPMTPVAGDVDGPPAADVPTAAGGDVSTSTRDASPAPAAREATGPAVTQAAPPAAQPADAPAAFAPTFEGAPSAPSVTPTLGDKASPTEATADAAAKAAHVCPSVGAPCLAGVDALMASPSALIVPARSADSRSRTPDATVSAPELPAPPGGLIGFGLAALSGAGSSPMTHYLLLVADITLAAPSCRTSLAAAAAAWRPVAFVWLLERPG
jgi:hypothetical protein